MPDAPKKKARKLDVYNFKDACKALRTALDKVDDLTIRCEKDRAEHAKEYRLRLAAETDAKSAREQFGDLKKRLLVAETENARLSGYLERVREDDAVADPLVEIEDAGGKRMVSKRHPSNTSRPIYGGINTESNEGWDNYGNRREKPKHWITY